MVSDEEVDLVHFTEHISDLCPTINSAWADSVARDLDLLEQRETSGPWAPSWNATAAYQKVASYLGD